MRTRTLRDAIAAILAGVGASCALASCCETRSYDRTVTLYEDGGTSVGLPQDAGGEGGCAALCNRAEFGCGNGVLVQCGPDPASRGAAIRCEFESTSCPTRPAIGGAICGRRPEGLREGACDAEEGSVGALFARMAALEAASVPAFRALARELAAHGAPAGLVRAARGAAQDEARHYRAMRALARRYGARPGRVSAPRGEVRSLERVATENAVEGCVRETFGALVAAWQARRAGDPAVRAAMEGVAADEASHAALAWRVHAWALARLDAEAQARVRASARDAVDALAAEFAVDAPREVVAVAGVPRASEARALVEGARRALWS